MCTSHVFYARELTEVVINNHEYCINLELLTQSAHSHVENIEELWFK